jgi:hypothetical protein
MRFKQIFLAGICLLLAPLSALTQGKTTPRARELFVTQRSDGLEVTVKWLDRNGQFIVVNPGREFKQGDKLRVEFRSNFNGIVYFMNISPKGVMRIIHKDTVRANTVNALPSSPDDTFQFDNEPGVEALKIILARQPIDDFEVALNRSGGRLGGTSSGVVDELSQGGGQKSTPYTGKGPTKLSTYQQNTPRISGQQNTTRISEEVGVVTPKLGQECGGLELSIGGKKLNCRGMIVAKGNERKGEGAVFVAASNSAKSGALQSGDVAVMELRFRHVIAQE